MAAANDIDLDAVVTALQESIRRFGEGLTGEQEVGFRLLAGPAEVFHFEGMAPVGGGLIEFRGVSDTDRAVSLLQHASQVNLLLVAVRKRSETVKRFGFIPQRE